MFKLDYKPKQVTYMEAGQSNPIKWEMLFLEGDEFSPTSGLLQCRDYFNDLAIYLQTGKEFSVYGFRNKVKINEDGQWIRLYNLIPEWFDNVERLVNGNKPFFMNVGVEVYPLPKATEALIKIPKPFYEKTYYISLLTQILRGLNYKKESSLEELFTDFGHPMCYKELGSPAKRVLATGFNLPDKYKEFVWYFNQHYNSQNDINDNYIRHNNGWRSWDGGVLV